MRNEPFNKSGDLPYVERPDVIETFVDSLETVIFDGTSVRMEFVVHRFDPPNAKGVPSGRKVTAARLVLPLSGALNLASQLESLIAALSKQGAIREVMPFQSSGDVN